MRQENIPRLNGIPLFSATSLVTPNAVSVVIWIGPRCLVGNPRTRSSDVRSRGGSSPEIHGTQIRSVITHINFYLKFPWPKLAQWVREPISTYPEEKMGVTVVRRKLAFRLWI
jgi:hypothetical protein